VKEVQVSSSPFQRRDNFKNVKLGWGHLKIFFLRTTGPEKLRFTGKFPNIMQNKFV
jgi:hypothetical protein